MVTEPDREPPLNNRARLLLGGYLVSAIGSGAVYPFTAVYVQQVRGLGGSVAAQALAVIALGTIVGSLLCSSRLDRSGPRTAGSVGLLLQLVGYGLLGLAAQPAPTFVACALIGLGAGTFIAVLAPAIDALCPPEQHRRAFAMRYLANNLGLGVGALVGSLVLSQVSVLRFTVLFEVDAASYLAFLMLFTAALAGSRPAVAPRRADRPSRPASGYRELLANRAFLRLMLVQTLLVVGGFAQFQSVIPLLLRVRLHQPAHLISVVLIVNTLGLVLLQPVVLRLSRRFSDSRMLSIVGVCWLAAFLVGLLAGVGETSGVIAILVFAGVFTVGECFYSPSFQPLVVRFAPAAELGRYSGIASSLWGTATFVAPPLGVLLVNSAPGAVLWLGCAGCAAAAAGCAWLLPGSTGPARDA